MSNVHPAMAMLGRVVSSVARTLGYGTPDIKISERQIALTVFAPITPGDVFTDALCANLRRLGFDHLHREIAPCAGGQQVRITLHVEDSNG